MIAPDPGDVLGVHLVAVPVALEHLVGSVEPRGRRARSDQDAVRAEAHGRTLLLDPLLLGQDVDDRVGRAGVELRRVRPFKREGVAAEFDRGDLESEADPEEGDLVLAGVLCRLDLPLDAAPPESAGNHDRVDAGEGLLPAALPDPLGPDPTAPP